MLSLFCSGVLGRQAALAVRCNTFRQQNALRFEVDVSLGLDINLICLTAFDEIKLEDVIIAWCSQSGEPPISALYSLDLLRLDNAAR
mgnify:CR=1 FL=1